MSTLDIVRATRDRIADPANPFDFHDWRHCTSGNIYAAATGRVADDQHDVTEADDPRYVDAVVTVAGVLGWEGPTPRWASPEWSATTYVSMATLKVADADAIDTRRAAVALLDTAAVALEELSA